MASLSGPGRRARLPWGGPHPGDRVPDVPLGPEDGPARLFQVLRGTKHVLLVFEGSHGDPDDGTIEAIAKRARRHHEEIAAYLIPRASAGPGWDGPVLEDPEGHLHDRFGARGTCLYLIRPDGYVGYRAMPADAEKLAGYLGSIFLG